MFGLGNMPSALNDRILTHIPHSHRERYHDVLKLLPLAAGTVTRKMEEDQRMAARVQTVFLLDWDDTCCATSHLEQFGMMVDFDCQLDQYTPELRLALQKLETRVLSLLKTAVQRGIVIIITNADDEWVELSASRFLPAVRAFLDDHYKSIKIVSARARYLETYPRHPLMWKTRTFVDELYALHRPTFNTELGRSVVLPLNVVVVGDSVGDQYASYTSRRKLAEVGIEPIVKFVKFLERPSIEQLSTEVAVLMDHLGAMIRYPSSIDVCMYKENQQAEVVCNQQPVPAQEGVTASRPHHGFGTSVRPETQVDTAMAVVA